MVNDVTITANDKHCFVLQSPVVNGCACSHKRTERFRNIVPRQQKAPTVTVSMYRGAPLPCFRPAAVSALVSCLSGFRITLPPLWARPHAPHRARATTAALPARQRQTRRTRGSAGPAALTARRLGGGGCRGRGLRRRPAPTNRRGSSGTARTDLFRRSAAAAASAAPPARRPLAAHRSTGSLQEAASLAAADGTIPHSSRSAYED